MLYYERKITNFIMLLNIVRSSVLKRHSYLYMARESEQRFDVSEKITVFLFLFAKFTCCIMRERLGKYKNLIENSKDDWRNEDVSFVRTRDQRTERCCLYDRRINGCSHLYCLTLSFYFFIREIYMLYYEKTRMCENDGKQRPARTKICT